MSAKQLYAYRRATASIPTWHVIAPSGAVIASVYAEKTAAFIVESYEANSAPSGRVARLEEALREIEKGEGAFSRDQLKHAANVIENAKAIARSALQPSARTGAE